MEDLDYDVGAAEDALDLLGIDDEDDDDFEALDAEIAGLDYEIGADEDDDLDDELDEDDDEVGFRLGGRTRARMRLGTGRPRRRRKTGRIPSAAMRGLFRQLAQNQKKLSRRNRAIARAVKMQRLSAAAKAGALPQIFLGVDSLQSVPTGIPAGGTRTIAVESTEPLRITNFLVDDAIASDFAVNRIQIGRLNLLAGSHPIPAAMFKSGIERPPMQTPTLPAGTEAKVEVTNRATAPRHFLGAFTGIDLTRRD
ncbi:MAG: hypothetical protein RIF41_33940 [Polyangiaceae bacterium]